MPSLFVRCMLFCSSYFPLMLIFSILLWRTNFYWAMGILTFGVFSLLVTYVYISRRKNRGGVSQAKITGVEKRDENVVGYMVSYLIPFVTFPLATPEQIAALLIFMGVLLILYVSSNMIYINPMFNLFGWHLYEISIDSDQVSHYLIARRDIRPDRHFTLWRLVTMSTWRRRLRRRYDSCQSRTYASVPGYTQAGYWYMYGRDLYCRAQG